jgi:hypothetical protein
VEYQRAEGVMRLRATTKIAAFVKKNGFQAIKPHDSPMTPDIAKSMTRANCPVTDQEKQLLKGKGKQYRMVADFFGYATNTVHVNCKNAARLLSRFLANPQERRTSKQRCMRLGTCIPTGRSTLSTQAQQEF